MAARRRRGGGGGIIGTTIWCIFILSCIFAWAKTPVPIGTEGIAGYAQAKSASVEAWVKDITADGGIDIGKIFKGTKGISVEIDGKVKELGSSGGNWKGGVDKKDSSQASAKLKKIKPGAAGNVDYDRKDWKHWTKAGKKSCWNTRNEVLAQEAVSGSIVYLDSSKKVTKSKSKACSVKSGKWEDPYTGKTFTNPSKLDIDHMIPLSYTANHGGQAWDAKKKEKYANVLNKPYHLVAVKAGANRQKGAKGPAAWKPSNKSYHCGYAVAWTNVASDWKLTLDQKDIKAIKGMMKTCKS